MIANVILNSKVIDMNKQELVSLISKNINMTKKDVKIIIDAFLNLLSEELKNNEKIVLSNFGVFETKKVNTYYRFHPQTGEKIKIKYPNRIYFRPSSKLKEYVNGEYNE